MNERYYWSSANHYVKYLPYMHTPTKTIKEELFDILKINSLVPAIKKKLAKKTIALEEKVYEAIPCPFASHQGYAKVWEWLTPKWQHYMKQNISITSDGKIEMIKMRKTFSLLTADHNGRDIFKWEHDDSHGKTWVPWYTYLTGKAAERECRKQYKGLLKDRAEVEFFISLFPGDDEESKCMNFVHLFGLQEAGAWSPAEWWIDINHVGYTMLSKIWQDKKYGKNKKYTKSKVYGVTWNATRWMGGFNPDISQLVVAYDTKSPLATANYLGQHAYEKIHSKKFS